MYDRKDFHKQTIRVCQRNYKLGRGKCFLLNNKMKPEIAIFLITFGIASIMYELKLAVSNIFLRLKAKHEESTILIKILKLNLCFHLSILFKNYS